MGQAELTEFERKVFGAVTSEFGDDVIGHKKHVGQLSITVNSEILFDLAEFLKESEALGFTLLSDICGVDWMKNPEARFEIVYNFYSLRNNERLLVKVFLPDAETPQIRSIQPLFGGADWLEREVYDMLGIVFEGHPDLRRIITPDGLEGWPHRKDFPLVYEMPRFSHNKDKPPEVIR
jgi:NADH-quinone oxidoreductase subunit C